MLQISPGLTEGRVPVRMVDFSSTPDIRYRPMGKKHDSLDAPVRPMTADGKLLTEKQIRARIRRRRAREEKASEQEIEHLYGHKSIEDWDLEELSRGRPRNKNGNFSGRKPGWVTREIHEKAMERFAEMVKNDMNSITVKALKFMADAIENDDVDEKGKPIVAASTKADLSKFLIEHVVGKPTQRVEQDVSVKLQGILGQVMVNPGEMQEASFAPAHYPGITMPMYEADDDAEVLDG